MTTSDVPPLSLSAFDLSPDRGFLPATDPLEHLPEEPILTQIGAELPKLLSARRVRGVIQDRQDIMALAQHRLVDGAALQQRANAALDYYVGDARWIQHHLADALALIASC